MLKQNVYKTWRVTFFSFILRQVISNILVLITFWQFCWQKKQKLGATRLERISSQVKSEVFIWICFYGENGSTYQIKILFGFPQFVSK